MAKFNEQFIGQYSLSKTLRFELKPIGKTAENIKANGFLEHDIQRAGKSVLVKQLLNDYYRFYIEKSLNGKELDADLIEKAYSAYVNGNTEKCKEINKTLCGQVENFFSDKKKHGLKKYRELFNVTTNRETNDTEGILLSWVKNNDKYSEVDKENFERIIKYFKGFNGYFNDFKIGKDNMFKKDGVTAIANRIVNENMYRFFDNVTNFAKIKKDYPDLYSQLANVEQYFVPSAFGKILSQSAIDNYNKGVIGRFKNDLDAKGVNRVINEYRQNCLKNGKEIKRLPIMTVLYKQILSIDETKNENISKKEIIDTDDRAINLARDSYRILVENVKEIKKLIDKSITEKTLDTIYIKKTEISTVSNAIFGNREIIKDALNYKKEKYKEVVCVKTISDAIKEYKQVYDGEIFDWKDKNIDDLFVKYFSSFYTGYVTKSKNTKKQKDEIVNIIEYVDNIKKELDTIVSNDVRDYKNILDKINAIVRFYKMFYLYDGMKKLDIRGKNEYFYNHFELMYFDIKEISKKYNEIRNYATKITQPNNGEKLKITFDVGTLLDGWDKNKEKDNLSILLVKDGKYYLGVMNSENKKCFDFSDADVMQKVAQLGDKYQKLEYKQLSGANKMLPKCFFAKSNTFFGKKYDNFFAPSARLQEIKERKLYAKDANDKQAMYEWIDFCKDSIMKHPEWSVSYAFHFSDTKMYQTVNEFYHQVDSQAYRTTYVNVSAKYIDELVEQGKLYLFQIYNKDFSDNKKQKGTDNLHTLYWKALFSPENMNNTDGPIIKLNGGAEIFYRFKADGIPVIHKKGSILLNRISKYGETIPSKIYKRIFDCLNGKIEKQNLNEEELEWYSKAVWKEAKYDIIKDKRYYGDDGKYFFHCPVTLNFRSSNGEYGYNEKVNNFVAGNTDIHIIGIDRGERHLLYYTVIDQHGNIIEQDSLNNISSDYVANNKLVPHKVNYHDLLDKREQERADARLAWTAIENIKEIKSGYLSQVVHKLALLVEKYNAIIVLEKLNKGFKRSRLFREKQVYQNFEKALIQKFNYLVFKNRSYAEGGSFAKGYQLTAPFTSFKDLEKYWQTGILYYVDPSYTSHICPKTGFVKHKNLNRALNYVNVETAKKTMAKFDSFKFNNVKGYFEFAFDYKNFADNGSDYGKWTICTFGDARYSYDSRTQTTTKYNVTGELKNLLAKYNVAYEDGKDLLGKIKDIDEKGFYSALLYWLRLTMQLRYTVKGTENEDDYILSPVADKNGNFFDSRKAQDNEPKNADANGAYHIALKGLQLIQNMQDGKLAALEKNKEQAKWFKFARERNS